MARVYGLDLGTSSLKIYQKNKGIIYNQKNAIAVFNKKKVIATGDEAAKMEGKTPPNIEVIYPMRAGVPADIKHLVAMLDIIFEGLTDEHGKLNGQEFILAVPTNITEVEKRAFVSLLTETNVKPKLVRVVDMPIADALGTGVDIREVTGTIVVDMGAETVEISVLSYGGIVTGKTLSFGGKMMDESIASAIRKYYNYMVGAKSAEQVKIALGSAVYPEENEVKTMKVFGRDIVSGLPGSIPIDSVFVHLAIKEHLDCILDAIMSVLENVPPEISVDVLQFGIHLTGGLSGIRNLDRFIRLATKIPVYVADNGSLSAAEGLGRVMEERELNFLAEKYTSLQILD